MIHFEPLGHTARHELHVKTQKQQQRHQHDDEEEEEENNSRTTYSDAQAAFDTALLVQDKIYPKQRYPDGRTTASSSSIPHYVWPNYESWYRQQSSVFESEEGIYPKPTKVIFGKINAHTAASLGDLVSLKELARSNRSDLFKADMNGWRPIHEAARSGHADVIEYLIEEGAEINERTNNGKGGNPLFWAEKDKIKNAKAIEVLKKYGAVNLHPIVG